MRGIQVTLISAVVLLASVAACGGSDDSFDGEDKPLSGSDLGETEDARAFLDSDDGAVWCEPMSIDALREFVEKLHAAGAESVLFGDITEIEGRRLSAWLVIELPLTGPSRATVFRAFNAVHHDLGEDEIQDEGQKYLDLPLD